MLEKHRLLLLLSNRNNTKLVCKKIWNDKCTGKGENAFNSSGGGFV